MFLEAEGDPWQKSRRPRERPSSPCAFREQYPSYSDVSGPDRALVNLEPLLSDGILLM